MAQQPQQVSKSTQVSKSVQAMRGARLCAVQAVYQIELTGKKPDNVIREFNDYRITEVIEVAESQPEDKIFAKREFFDKIVAAVSQDIIMVDAQIERRLSNDWTLERIDPIARAALRCAVYELLNMLNIPVAVTINEYVSVVASFGDGKDAGFVNGILDKIAKETKAADARN